MNANTPIPKAEQELARQLLAALDRAPPSACPDASELAAYLDGQLGPAAAAELEGHLAACATCRKALIEARALLRDATELPTPGLVAAACELVPRAGPHQRRSPWRRVPRWAAAAAAALALGAAGLKAGATVRKARVQAEAQPDALLTLAQVDTESDIDPFTRLAANGEEVGHE
jgi:anti-sigma factor RsiW